MPVAVGDTFLIATGSPSDPNRNHLLVAIIDIPVDAGGMILLVPISSIKAERRHDTTCVILAADHVHPFTTLDSFVEYAVITQMTPKTILRRAIPDAGGNPGRSRLPDDLMRRVRQGRV
jgi:hypothetical protein